MILSFFDQFTIPSLLGVPLIIPALLFPPMIWFTTNRLVKNRYSTLQSSLLMYITKQMMLPISITGHKWASTFITLMLMLMLFNTLGLLPYTFTPTTQLSMNMALATPAWLMTVLTGLRNQPTTSLGHLLPEGTPTLLIPMLILIETASLLIRPIALGVRLTANLTAGHLLIQLTSTAVLALMNTMTITSMMALIMLILLSCLEMAVALIQAYVFVLLLTLYLQENI
uniref:ATP synthase subunit a n=2 Tax=Darevskia TaxID=122330 RepID=A0A6B7FC01_DARSA|nr:ATP synthase F0 subunit 6 [Darevskia saxicola]YP_009910941.1 ATP synthase F0 subunit 6 [Darevskia brauneri]QBA55853.1 ATP synthase F0 subunit 6 [Darevskia saxicola]QDP70170.1 ATP synthase F0 subunit 6 [Darevskia brauneri]